MPFRYRLLLVAALVVNVVAIIVWFSRRGRPDTLGDAALSVGWLVAAGTFLRYERWLGFQGHAAPSLRYVGAGLGAAGLGLHCWSLTRQV